MYVHTYLELFQFDAGDPRCKRPRQPELEKKKKGKSLFQCAGMFTVILLINYNQET